jgi:hypothetical protein
LIYPAGFAHFDGIKVGRPYGGVGAGSSYDGMPGAKMKKQSKSKVRRNRVVRGSGNVFLDLGFS